MKQGTYAFSGDRITVTHHDGDRWSVRGRIRGVPFRSTPMTRTAAAAYVWSAASPVLAALACGRRR